MNEDKTRVRLKEARLKKRLEQPDVAAAIGISRVFYNQIEKGKRNPRLENALKISELLEIDVKDWS